MLGLHVAIFSCVQNAIVALHAPETIRMKKVHIFFLPCETQTTVNLNNFDWSREEKMPQRMVRWYNFKKNLSCSIKIESNLFCCKNLSLTIASKLFMATQCNLLHVALHAHENISPCSPSIKVANLMLYIKIKSVFYNILLVRGAKAVRSCLTICLMALKGYKSGKIVQESFVVLEIFLSFTHLMPKQFVFHSIFNLLLKVL